MWREKIETRDAVWKEWAASVEASHRAALDAVIAVRVVMVVVGWARGAHSGALVALALRFVPWRGVEIAVVLSL